MSGKNAGGNDARRFKSYPAYRDSGVEWLGEIPANWEVKPNGALFCERDERGRDDLPIMEVSISSGVRVREFSDTKIEQRSDDLGVYKVARAGDIAFNKMRMWQGAVGTTLEDGLVSPDYIVAQPRPGTESAYYAAAFRTPLYMTEVFRWSHGIVDDRNRLYWDNFKTIHSPVPPTSDQRGIAAFLDRETARIDALVARKERLIELLQEKRTALITRAVTKGLDPNVPMKDSGVEWLGEIPAHWEVKRLGQAMESLMDFRGRTPAKLGMDWGGDIPAVSAVNVREGHLDLSRGVNYGSQALHDRWMAQGRLRKGDVLFTTEAPLGNVALVPDDKQYILSQRVVLLRPHSAQLIPEYLQRFLISLPRSARPSIASRNSAPPSSPLR